MSYIWLIIIFILLVVEVLEKNAFAIFYAFSALASAVFALIYDNYIIELVIFLLLGTILVIIFRNDIYEKITNFEKDKLKIKKNKSKRKK